MKLNFRHKDFGDVDAHVDVVHVTASCDEVACITKRAFARDRRALWIPFHELEPADEAAEAWLAEKAILDCK